MIDLPITESLLLAAGAGAWKVGSVLWQWRRAKRAERKQLDELEDDAAERLRRELESDSEKSRKRATAREKLYDDLRKRFDRLLSQLSDEKSARQEAEHERNAALAEHAECKNRLTAVEKRLDTMESRCRETCRHAADCPIVLGS